MECKSLKGILLLNIEFLLNTFVFRLFDFNKNKMKPSKELFRLIKSLTKSEKRYFKLSSNLQSGNKNYMRLFDAIEEQSEYDEDALKNQFKGETFIRHLPSEKSHLYNLILKSLRGFHSDKSSGAQLQEQLRNIELLYNKALYKECAKFIKRAKKLAAKHEKFYYLLDLVNWEKQLVEEEYMRGIFDKDLVKLVEEEHDCLKKLRNLAEYQILYSRINYAYRRGGYVRNEKETQIVKEVANHPLITGKGTAISVKASSMCYFIKGLCATTEMDQEDAYTNFNKVAKILENNPVIMQEVPKRYIRALNNLLFFHLDNQRFKEFSALIDKMRALKSKPGFGSIDVQMKIFTLTHNAELLVYDSTGQIDKGLRVIEEVIEGIVQYQDKLNIEEKIVLYYNVSVMYFAGGDYKKALHWINKVINVNEGDLRKDLFTFARLYNLIIHYELGNFDLLDYTTKSTSRYIKKKNRNYRFESLILKYIRRMIKAKSEKELQKNYKKFHKELKDVLKDFYEQAGMEYFDFLTWVESKIEDIPYPEIKRRKLQLSK